VSTTFQFWKEWVKYCRDKCARNNIYMSTTGLGPIISHTYRVFTPKLFSHEEHSDLCTSLSIPSVPILHFVRSPSAMVVSGHFYHKQCLESWLNNHFSSSAPNRLRFGNASVFREMLDIMGENPVSWDQKQKSWCGLLNERSDIQGVRAEALRTIMAVDGVKTMLQDRVRMRERIREIKGRHFEICNSAPSSKKESWTVTWGAIKEELNIKRPLVPNINLEKSHTSHVPDAQRETMTDLASVELHRRLNTNLLKEYPNC